jgi:diguanylate cyclase (GGDEF)-like protein
MTDESMRPLILVVDDTPTNIQLLAEGLMADYRIKVATSGRAALEIVASHEMPDAILLDVMMPEMDGYEVCRQLKQDPKTAQIPVIFITAMNEMENEEHGLRLGAVDYIAKPFHLPIVRARLHNHLQIKLATSRLESMVWLDGLTGIPNRRRFDEALEEEWRRAKRAGSPLSLIMADVDHFKSFNDCYGHSAGDACLRQIAGVLASAVTRGGDMVARYGGEEFVLLVPNTNLAGARVLAEQLCTAVQDQRIPHDYSATAHWVTISTGYASAMPGNEAGTAALVDEADAMLYNAKRFGRNRAFGPLDSNPAA